MSRVRFCLLYFNNYFSISIFDMHKALEFSFSQALYIFIYEFSGSEEDRLKLYKDIEQLFPRASAPRRLPLNFAEGKTLCKHQTV